MLVKRTFHGIFCWTLKNFNYLSVVLMGLPMTACLYLFTNNICYRWINAFVGVWEIQAFKKPRGNSLICYNPLAAKKNLFRATFIMTNYFVTIISLVRAVGIIVTMAFCYSVYYSYTDQFASDSGCACWPNGWCVYCASQEECGCWHQDSWWRVHDQRPHQSWNITGRGMNLW